MLTLANIRKRISALGINSATITVVAVTKTVPIERIEEAINAGFTHFGENRIQEAAQKISYFRQKYPHLKWHLLGHLQTNKINKALELFDVIQSVDSLRLAQELSKKAMAKGIKIEIYLEVKVSKEESKFGIEPLELCDIIEKTAKLPGIAIKGLMTIAPLLEDTEKTRPYFKQLKQLAEKTSLRVVSMGMSDDFEIAVQEGSNMIRLGRAIFGQRRI